MRTFHRPVWLLLLVLMVVVAACQPGSLTTPGAPTPTEPGQADAAQPTATAATTGAAPTETAAPNEAAPAFALRLRAALAACEAAGVDQVCYGEGAVTLAAQPGAALPAFAEPGAVADLADVAGLSLGGGDSWGLAVLRLSAGLDDPAQALTLVAMGPAEITDLATVLDEAGFDWTIGGGDLTDLAAAATPAAPAPGDLPAASAVEPLQRLTLASGPASEDFPSGLLMWSPWEGDVAAVEINGAAIALGSMAFIQGEGGVLTVGMFEGAALVTVGEATFAVPAGAQAQAPGGAPVVLDPRAQAIAQAVAQYGLEPRDPRAEAISQAVDKYGQDPAAHDAMLEDTSRSMAEIRARYIVQKYRAAIRRCTDPAHPNPRYVYNLLYWDNVLDTIRDTPALNGVLGATGLATLQADARRCLSFELDFASTVEVTSPKVSYVVEVKADAIKIEYANTGFMAWSETGEIYHARFNVVGDEAGCPGTESIENGTLTLNGGFLRVYHNELEVMMDFWPQVAHEMMLYNCAGYMINVAAPWFPIFGQAHMEEFLDGTYRFYDWQVSENEHFAETIYETTVPMDVAEGHVTTYMVLVHTPQTAP